MGTIQAVKIEIQFFGLRSANLQTMADCACAMMANTPSSSDVLLLAASTDIDDTVDAIAARPELDILHVGNDIRLPVMQLTSGCMLIGEELARCPNRPWVHLQPRLGFLRVTFSNHRLRVWEGDIETVIRRRQDAYLGVTRSG
jgi:hypothetical protein